MGGNSDESSGGKIKIGGFTNHGSYLNEKLA
jgi:hypothetical protein